MIGGVDDIWVSRTESREIGEVGVIGGVDDIWVSRTERREFTGVGVTEG